MDSAPRAYCTGFNCGSGCRGGRLRFVLHLTTHGFAEEEGTPCHLSVLDQRTLLFGLPMGGGLWYDFVAIRCSGRVVAPLKDRQARPLVFGPQDPIATPGALVGLASTGPGLTGVRYLLRVMASGASLKRVSSNTVLVTYDPARGVGLGVAEKGGVTVRYEVLH